MLLLGNALHCQLDGKIRTKLDSYLSVQVERIGFSGVLLIADEDKVLYQKAIGSSSFELKAPTKIDTKFKTASITKSFTGMLLAIAESEGKIGLNDSLKTYFPDIEMHSDWERITIKELVSHTSGIPHWKGYKDYWPIKSRVPLRDEQVLADIFAMELIDNAGTTANYSSPGYFLLAKILERAYMEPFGKLFKEKIAAPLGLEGSGIFDGTTIVSGMASGHHRLPNDSLINAPHRDMSTMKGGGNLYSNANDLLKWNRSLMGQGPWEASLLEDYLTPFTKVTFPQNNNATYAMGQYVHPKTAARPMAYQTAGGTFGFSTISVIYPEEKITLMVLANVSFLPVNEIWDDVEKIIFDRPFELPEIVKGSQLSKAELDRYTGTYVAENGMELEIGTSKAELYAKLGNNPPLKIVHNKDGLFKAVKLDIDLKFTSSGSGKVNGVIADGRGQTHNFKKR